MPRRRLPPIHFGEILREEFLVPLSLSQYRLARETSVSLRRINKVVCGVRAISADMSLRLAADFGTSECFWLNRQAHDDLEVEKDRLNRKVKALTPTARTSN